LFLLDGFELVHKSKASLGFPKLALSVSFLKLLEDPRL